MKRSLIAITFLLIASTAHATTMVPLDVRALTQRADRVVLGTVEKTQAAWTADHDAIYTEVTIRVARSYKGALAPGDALVVRHEGGIVGGVGMRVYGAAGFTVGEEVVVFAETRGGGSYVVGMAQGKLRVTTTADGRRTVATDTRGLKFLTPPDPNAPRTRPLEELEAQLHQLVEGAK